MDHLIPAHGLNREGVAREIIGFSLDVSVSSQSSQAKPLPHQPPLNPDVFENFLLRWIVINQVAFSKVTSPPLSYIFGYLYAVQASFTDLANAIPIFSSMISSWIMDCFSQNKVPIQHHLKPNSIPSIYLTFDLWTSTNYLALVGIIAFWIDTFDCIQHALLGLPRLLGAHTGDNQGQRLWEVITKYGFQHLISYFCLDNASNNLTAL